MKGNIGRGEVVIRSIVNRERPNPTQRNPFNPKSPCMAWRVAWRGVWCRGGFACCDGDDVSRSDQGQPVKVCRAFLPPPPLVCMNTTIHTNIHTYRYKLCWIKQTHLRHYLTAVLSLNIPFLLTKSESLYRKSENMLSWHTVAILNIIVTRCIQE